MMGGGEGGGCFCPDSLILHLIFQPYIMFAWVGFLKIWALNALRVKLRVHQSQHGSGIRGYFKGKTRGKIEEQLVAFLRSARFGQRSPGKRSFVVYGV